MTESLLQMQRGRAVPVADAVVGSVPEFTTVRLRLRAPLLGDFPAYAEVFASDRARYMGGPFTGEQAFADFCQGVAGWMLRGAGMWTLTLRADDAALGWIYLWQEWGDPEPELGWVLREAAEGQGYAQEAARAALPLALALYGPGGFVSYIDAANTRSARLAAALGAARDPAAEARMSASGEAVQVWRHTGAGVPA